MSLIARQSTARTLMIGPVLDADGVAVTGGVVGDFKISKNGAAPAGLNGSATLTHRHTGFYSLALTASDLDTVGQAEVTIDDTVNACPLRVITVIEPAVYDALFADAATGMLPANVIQVLGDAQSATDAKDFYDAGYDPSTNKVQGVVLVDTATTLTNAPSDSSGVTTLLGKFTGITLLAQWLGAIAGKQSPNSTAQTEIRATGAGSGTFDATTDSQEAVRDRGDSAWTTATGFSTHSAADVWAVGTRTLTSISALASEIRSAIGLATANLDTQLSSIATNVSTVVTRIPAALFAGITSLAEWLGLIAGKQTGNSTARTELRATGAGSGTYDETADSQEAIRDRGDAAWADSGTPPTAAAIASQVRTELTTELGRIDVAVSSRLAASSTGSGFTAIPWNASWDAEVQSEMQDALDTMLADSVPADGTRPTLAQAVYMITQFLMERSVSGTTVTVKKADGSTTLMTFTINDASTPTSITRAS